MTTVTTRSAPSRAPCSARSRPMLLLGLPFCAVLLGLALMSSIALGAAGHYVR